MGTRERVLQAALDCFNEAGCDRTSVAWIRDRSGVSNGSLFHHFPNKESIIEALYLEAMREVQRGYWAVLDNQPASLRDSVDGIVRNLLLWIEANPHWARFLYSQGQLDWSTAAGSELRRLNNDLADAYREWLAPFIASGEVRDLPMMIVVAIINGPVHAVAQRWLAGQVTGLLVSYADQLIEAAVAGLSGSPTAGSAPARRQPTTGQIRLTLTTEDGDVVAEGQAVTALTTVSSVSATEK